MISFSDLGGTSSKAASNFKRVCSSHTAVHSMCRALIASIKSGKDLRTSRQLFGRTRLNTPQQLQACFLLQPRGPSHVPHLYSVNQLREGLPNQPVAVRPHSPQHFS